MSSNQDNFMDACINGNYEDAIKYHPYGDDLSSTYAAFHHTCKNGHLRIAQWLHSMHAHFHTTAEFVSSCSAGQLEVAQWLLSLSDKSTMEYMSYDAFRLSCINNHLHIAQWLHSEFNNVVKHFGYSYLFGTICSLEYTHIAQWMYQINPNVNISLAIHICIYKNDNKYILQWLCSLDPFVYRAPYFYDYNKSQMLFILHSCSKHNYCVSAGIATTISEFL